MSENFVKMTAPETHRSHRQARPSRNLFNTKLGRKIIKRVCEYYQLDVDVLLSNQRINQTTWVRHLCMDIMSMAGLSTTTIAKLLGRERTLVTFARKKVDDYCDAYKDLAEDRKKIASEFVTLTEE